MVLKIIRPIKVELFISASSAVVLEGTFKPSSDKIFCNAEIKTEKKMLHCGDVDTVSLECVTMFCIGSEGINVLSPRLMLQHHQSPQSES